MKPSSTSSRWSILSSRCCERRLQDLAAVVEEGAQHLLEAADLGRAPVDQHVHVEAEADLEIGVAVEHPHQHLGIDAARLGLDDQPHVVGALVPDIAENRDLADLDQLGQLLDQARFLHLIGDFGDHDLPGAATQILDLPAGAQPESCRGRCGRPRRYWRAARRCTPPVGKSGPGTMPTSVSSRASGRLDQMQAGLDQLADIMRRDVGRHADGDAARSIGQQVGEGGGQHHRLFQRAVVIGAEIDGVLGQPLHQRLGRGGQPGLGVAAGGGVVAVDIAEVALPVDQRVADVEILRQPRHRVIDRGVAMGVIVAHHVARDLGRLAEPARRGQPAVRASRKGCGGAPASARRGHRAARGP